MGSDSRAGADSALGTATRLIPKVRTGSADGGGRKLRIGAQSRAAAPGAGASHGTYVADSFTGDLTATMGGGAVLAHDGEPAGLARVTLAMRPTVRREPAPRQLVGLALWAAALGILGSILAIRDAVGLFLGAPGWFMPTAALIGIVGIGLTMGAFLTARNRILPWTMLGVATCALGAVFLATLLAF